MTKYSNMPDLLDIEVAGKLIGAGRCKAYEMSCTGELPTVNIGRKKFVPKWELIMKFRLMPGAELIRLLVKEMGKEEVLKIIEKECI